MSIARTIARARCLLILTALPIASAQDNVLILLTDDLGVDSVTCYAEGTVPPPTPNIDALAQGGILFRNAWSNPACSPSRSHLQTGRYGFRTGIGMVVSKNGWALSLEELTLPEAFEVYSPHAYSDGYFGKWHLGNPTVGGIDAPNLAGWTHFAGTATNLYQPQDYFNWVRIENGSQTNVTDYATSRLVDDFLAWQANAPEPWVALVAFHAPHEPFHAPPAHLHTQTLPDIDPRKRPTMFYRAMVEAMDTEIGRLLGSLGQQRDRTNVILMGDNGTPKETSVPPFMPSHAKLTPYEGGINVPLIVNGPRVLSPGREVAGLVNSTDLFATALELGGANMTALHAAEKLDSVSMVPYLEDPTQEELRTHVFSELFSPNGVWHHTELRMVRNKRYKVIRRGTAKPYTWEFFDLKLDPFEQDNLIQSGLSPDARLQLRILRAELINLLKS